MPARILIIEDDPGSAELARYLLDSAGHAVLIAIDGSAGARMAVEEKPDIVLCDLHLPVMNGPAVVAQVLADPNWQPVPFIALTASSMVGDREKTLAWGFDDYLSKPITPETFVRQIEGFLPLALRIGVK